MLLGREKLSLQGFPWTAFEVLGGQEYSESFLSDLAGNAMSGPTIMAAFLALWAAMTKAEGSEQDELMAISKSFARGFDSVG